MIIKLANGTTIDAVLTDDGPYRPLAYMTEQHVTDETFAEDALSNVIIDGDEVGRMQFEFCEEPYFYIRKPTEIEDAIHVLTVKVAQQEEIIRELEEKVFPTINITLKITATNVGGFVSLMDVNGVPVIEDILEVEVSETTKQYAVSGHIPDGTYFFRGDNIVLGRNGEIRVFTVAGEDVNAGTFDVMTWAIGGAGEVMEEEEEN